MKSKATFLGCVLFALLAHNSTAKAWSLYAGILGGYGFTPQDHEVQPYGFNFGAAAGITLPLQPIYLGARLLWFAGDTGHATASGTGGSVDVDLSLSYLTYGVDLGYDFELGPLVLRPELGIGRATLNVNQVGQAGFNMTEVNSSLYLAPAAEVLVKLGFLFAGAEVRYMGLTASKQYSGVALLAHLGLTI